MNKILFLIFFVILIGGGDITAQDESIPKVALVRFGDIRPMMLAQLGPRRFAAEGSPAGQIGRDQARRERGSDGSLRAILSAGRRRPGSVMRVDIIWTPGSFVDSPIFALV